MNPKIRTALLLVVLAGAGGYFWFSQSQMRKESATAATLSDTTHSVILNTEFSRIKNEVAALVQARDFQGLDKLSAQFRQNDERTSEGLSKISMFYEGASFGLNDIEQHTGMADVDTLLDDWKDKYPESLTQILVKASYKMDAAFRARGTGWAQDVRESQWKVYADLLNESQLALAESAKITDQHDPYAMLLYVQLANSMGVDREQIQPVIEESIKTYPAYEGTFRQMAIYLMPRWHGQPGEMEAFAEDLYQRLPAPQGAIMYARISEKVWPYEKDKFFENTSFSYERTREGFNALFELYPDAIDSKKLLSRFAVFHKDQATAHKMFTQIGEWPSDDVKGDWGTAERLEAIRQWAAGAGENPTEVTPLEVAVTTGNMDEVTSAIKNGGDVNRRTGRGSNLLCQAMDDGYQEIAVLLMENGADVTAEGRNGYKVVTAAAKAENLVVLEKGLRAGFGINDPVGSTGWTLLHTAALEDSAKSVDFLSKYPGVTIDSRTGKGWTPLIAAAHGNAVDSAKILLKYGADVNAGDNINITPLHQAAYSGAAEMIKFLLVMGGDPAIASTSGVQPLDAAKGQHKAEATALIEEALAKAK